MNKYRYFVESKSYNNVCSSLEKTRIELEKHLNKLYEINEAVEDITPFESSGLFLQGKHYKIKISLKEAKNPEDEDWENGCKALNKFGKKAQKKLEEIDRKSQETAKKIRFD